MPESLPHRDFYLSICVIVRDEALYLPEWLAFHRLVGVEHFFVYIDPATTDSTPQILSSQPDCTSILWTPDLQAHYHSQQPCPFGKTPQVTAFNHFCRAFTHLTQWCAFIDVDEYLYHNLHDDIREPLSTYRHRSQWVQWLVFGRNSHLTRPNLPTIEAYTRRGAIGKPYPYGCQGKIIVDPAVVKFWGPYGSHNAVLHTGQATYNEAGRLVLHANTADPTANYWRLNHYYNRSLEEAQHKVSRGDNNTIPGFDQSMVRMDRMDLNDFIDLDIQRFLPRLKKALSCPTVSSA